MNRAAVDAVTNKYHEVVRNMPVREAIEITEEIMADLEGALDGLRDDLKSGEE